MYSCLTILLNGNSFWLSTKLWELTNWKVLIWLKYEDYVQAFESTKEKFQAYTIECIQ